MAGHKFQVMDCLMFQNLSDSVTRSPIELFWTAKNCYGQTYGNRVLGTLLLVSTRVYAAFGTDSKCYVRTNEQTAVNLPFRSLDD